MKAVIVLFAFASALPLIWCQCLTENDTKIDSDPETRAILRDGKKEFAIDLFKELSKTAKMVGKDDKAPDTVTNTFFSPESVYQALLMAFFGAEGETEQELRRVLHIGNVSKVEVRMTYLLDTLYQQLRVVNSSNDLAIANRLYFEKTVQVRPCIRELFPDELHLVDFVHDSENVRVQINGWVEEQTRGKINELIPSGYIDQSTLLALVNSAYFKGNWDSQFKEQNTKLATFYIAPLKYSQVKMMHQKGNFKYVASHELMAQVIELPYEGHDVSMVILLPPFVPRALDETMKRLNADTFHAVYDDMFERTVEVSLPKFRLEQEFELSPTLGSLGTSTLFDSSAANLTGFADFSKLAFGSALHKSYVEVNEQGAEAAAATSLIAFRNARPLESVEFVCNRPFIFLIYDQMADSILFLGAYRTPKS